MSIGLQVYPVQPTSLRPLQGVMAHLDVPGVPDINLSADGANSASLVARLDRTPTCGTRGLQILQLKIAGTGELLDRTIPLYAVLVCQKGDYTYKVHLASRSVPSFNIKYIRQALPMLNHGDADAALAYLWVAMDEYQKNTPDEMSDYSCWLKHYYAEALQQACVLDTFSYATCDEANQMYQDLEHSPRCQTIVNSTARYYQTAEANVLAKKTRAAMSVSDYASATEGWKEIGDIAKNVDLSSVGLPSDLLKTWTGLTYMRLGAQQSDSPEDAKKSYDSAAAQLESVQNPGPVAKQSKVALAQIRSLNQ